MAPSATLTLRTCCVRKNFLSSVAMTAPGFTCAGGLTEAVITKCYNCPMNVTTSQLRYKHRALIWLPTDQASERKRGRAMRGGTST